MQFKLIDQKQYSSIWIEILIYKVFIIVGSSLIENSTVS